MQADQQEARMFSACCLLLDSFFIVLLFDLRVGGRWTSAGLRAVWIPKDCTVSSHRRQILILSIIMHLKETYILYCKPIPIFVRRSFFSVSLDAIAGCLHVNYGSSRSARSETKFTRTC